MSRGCLARWSNMSDGAFGSVVPGVIGASSTHWLTADELQTTKGGFQGSRTSSFA